MDPFPRNGVPLPQGVFSFVSGARAICCSDCASGKDSGIHAARTAIIPACSHKVAINASIASR